MTEGPLGWCRWVVEPAARSAADAATGAGARVAFHVKRWWGAGNSVPRGIPAWVVPAAPHPLVVEWPAFRVGGRGGSLIEQATLAGSRGGPPRSAGPVCSRRPARRRVLFVVGTTHSHGRRLLLAPVVLLAQRCPLPGRRVYPVPAFVPAVALVPAPAFVSAVALVPAVALVSAMAPPVPAALPVDLHRLLHPGCSAARGETLPAGTAARWRARSRSASGAGSRGALAS